MKIFVFAILLTQSVIATAQKLLPDNFTIGDFAEVYSSDSIKIYFDCAGDISVKRCADYYRVGKIDPECISVTGLFHDYFLNGKLYFEASMNNGDLNGPAKYYYSNGQLKEEGQYQNNQREGKWVFYYPNGKTQKIYLYEHDLPLVLEAFTPNNEQTTINGNGYLKTEFSMNNACTKFETAGNLVNGKRQGAWTFSNIEASPIDEEIYDNGNYVKSRIDKRESITNPNTGLSVFYGNENLKLISSDINCPGDYNENGKSVFPLTTYLFKLQKQFDTSSLKIKNQWLIVGLKIGTKNKLLSLNVASSKNDTILENYVYNTILKTKKWQPTFIKNKKVEADFFFTIFVDNNKIFVPECLLHRSVR